MKRPGGLRRSNRVTSGTVTEGYRMNADRRVETLRRLLYKNSGVQVYGILDGASIPNLLPLLS